MARIEKHEMAVWAVKFVGEDNILTGECYHYRFRNQSKQTAGADKKIYLHSIDVATGRSTVLQEYTGHSQVVRGISLRTDGKGFWSCGNDG